MVLLKKLHFFLQEPVKLNPRLTVLKIFMIFRIVFTVVLNLFLFSPDFLKIFHNTVMIYNTRNRNNDTTESQKEKKNYFNAHAGGK